MSIRIAGFNDLQAIRMAVSLTFSASFVSTRARDRQGPMGFITVQPERIPMHELLRVWTERKGLLLIAASAVIYAIFLIPFNQLQWSIAGIAIRPAAALPVVLGIVWGPAAAWGLGIGNIAGDFFGSWSLLSIFGFLINMLYPYLSYLLWHRMMKGHEIQMDPFSISRYLAVAVVITLVCTALLALAGMLFFGRPFGSRFISYFGNNIMWAMTLGTVIFWLVLKKAISKGFVYGSEWVRRGIVTGNPVKWGKAGTKK